jgi:prenyltransferase beta subunit
MTIKREMIKTVGKAKELLGSSLDLVIEYVKQQQNPDGGFRGRSAESDLYYTVFGNDILTAFNKNPQYSVSGYISSVKTKHDSDFINLCSYISLLTSFKNGESFSADDIAVLKNLLETFRTKDGGYSVKKDNPHGSVYGCFLAHAAYENLGIIQPDMDKIPNCLKNLCAEDNGYSNEPYQKEGTTTATAAAIVLLRKLNQTVPEKTIEWILSQLHKSGGFLATPSTAIPDLLSTATALFALKTVSYDLSQIRENCLDFLDSVWDGNGAFRGHWFDEKTDVEYTFYALLSIGCISD